MNDLEYVLRNADGRAITQKMRMHITEPAFSADFSQQDTEKIEHRWAGIQKERPEVFSRPGSLASLAHIAHDSCLFRPTEFKEYAAVQQDVSRRELSGRLYENMRVASVGGVVRLSDGYVVVQRRADHLLAEPGKLDSGCAGFAMVKDGTLDFEDAVLSKLKQELNLTLADTTRVANTAIRCSRSDCYSAMWDFAIDVKLGSHDFKEHVKAYEARLKAAGKTPRIGECVYVHEEAVPAFVIEMYGRDKELIGDGAGALLSSLDQKRFVDTVRMLRRDGRKIALGTLTGGEFCENSHASTAQ
jgi:hypothetical protein